MYLAGQVSTLTLLELDGLSWELAFSSMVSTVFVDKLFDRDFYANVNGRAMNGTASPTAPSAIADILENELLPEKVMYYLWVDEKPQQAFKLAKKHWQKQRAWEDTELLLSSAKALGSEVEAQTKEEIEKWRLQWLH